LRIARPAETEEEVSMRAILLLLAGLATFPSLADEGMWTFDNFHRPP